MSNVWPRGRLLESRSRCRTPVIRCKYRIHEVMSIDTYTLGAVTAAFALDLLICRASRILAFASNMEAPDPVDLLLDHCVGWPFNAEGEGRMVRVALDNIAVVKAPAVEGGECG